MTDREKVIKGLEVCTSIADGESCPKECPYYQDVCDGYNQLMRYALALLKEQETVVHCGDCKYWDYRTEGCTHLTGAIAPIVKTGSNWYCHDGKRKDT
jgi:hypothetical protein